MATIIELTSFLQQLPANKFRFRFVASIGQASAKLQDITIRRNNEVIGVSMENLVK